MMTDYNAYKYSQNEALLVGARWAREDDIKSKCRKVRLSDPACEFRGGLPLISDGDTVYLDDSDAHSLIIGATGSKKTRLFAMPMLEIFRRAGESVVVTDPKGELFDLTAASYRASGYRVYTVNLCDTLRSDGWNPLALARAYYAQGDEDRAVSIVNDFAAAFIPDRDGARVDPFWSQTARAMLQGLAMMLVEGTHVFADREVNVASLRSLSNALRQERSRTEPGTLELLDTYPADSVARLNLDAICRGSEKTFDNIKASYDAPMQLLYSKKSLMDMLSNNDVDFNALGLRKTILFLIMPDEKTTLHVIVSLIIKQCYEQLIDLARKQAGNALKRRVNFLLDEFSNLPRIPDMAAMISAARSRSIRFHLVIQGLYQLSSKYGSDDAQTIKGNCGNWVFLTSRELPLLEEISSLCGSDAMTGERLISVSQLQRLDKDKGEALMLIGRQYPYIAHLADISRYRLAPVKKLALPSLRRRCVPVLPIEHYLARTSADEALSLDIKRQLEAQFDELFGSPGRRRRRSENKGSTNADG